MNYSIIHNIINGFGVDWDSALGGELHYHVTHIGVVYLQPS